MGCDDGSIIDVMVLYSQAARSAAGGTAAMHALIDLAVAETNDAFERSLVTTRLRLVHRQEVAYTETNDVELDSDRLIDPNDGYLDEMHPLRDLYGADCVSLWLDSYGGAGFGYFPHPSLKGVEASGITLMG